MGELILSHMSLGQRTAFGSCFFHFLYLSSKDGIQVTKLTRQVPLPHRPMIHVLVSSFSVGLRNWKHTFHKLF